MRPDNWEDESEGECCEVNEQKGTVMAIVMPQGVRTRDPIDSALDPSVLHEGWCPAHALKAGNNSVTWNNDIVRTEMPLHKSASESGEGLVDFGNLCIQNMIGDAFLCWHASHGFGVVNTMHQTSSGVNVVDHDGRAGFHEGVLNSPATNSPTRAVENLANVTGSPKFEARLEIIRVDNNLWTPKASNNVLDNDDLCVWAITLKMALVVNRKQHVRATFANGGEIVRGENMLTLEKKIK